MTDAIGARAIGAQATPDLASEWGGIAPGWGHGPRREAVRADIRRGMARRP